MLVNEGFRLHMDDFGSGYSSLITLNELPFTTLKIDKSLIDYIEQDKGKKVVRQVINLAHGPGPEDEAKPDRRGCGDSRTGETSEKDGMR